MPNMTYGELVRLQRGRAGTFTLNGSTPVVVANNKVTANSVIDNTIKTVGGTPAARIITSVTPGVGFTVVGTAGDTSTYNYLINM